VLDASSNVEASKGTVALLTRPGTRYVRVTFSDASPGAVIGVAEIHAFNYLRDDLTLGADLSYADERTTVDQAQFGAQFWSHPTGPIEECCDGWGGGPHVLDMVQEMGMEYIRLRIWNEPRYEGWEPGNPPSGTLFPIPYHGPERSKEVAKWIKADRGMGLGIDFHYSDSWADPNKQPKPRAWAELEFDDLNDAVYDFTSDYIQQLIDQGTTPDKVAVGNEIVNGFLYGSEASIIGTTDPPYFSEQAEIYQSQPGGGLLWDYWNSSDPHEQALYDEQWDRFSTLVASGIKAVRDVSSDNGEDIEVEIHVIIDNNQLAKTLEFWDQLLSRLATKGQTVDVLAHSYYPEWHGTPEHFEFNINEVAAANPGYKIDIAETSYPASGGDGSPLPNSPFPRTIQGQADAIQRVFTIANDVPDNRGVGVLMWEPLNWQDMVNWDSWPVVQPNASMDVFNKSRATHVVQDRVYQSVAVGDPLALPATVRALTTADGSVADVPVEWDDVPAGATDSPGELAVSGSTEFGDVTALVSVIAKAPTTTTVASSANPSKLGAAVRFTATVSGPAVGGTVQFAVDGTNLGGPVALSNAKAVSPATSALAAGAHSVTATYSGDQDTLGSSGSLTQTVQYVVHVLWPTAGSSVKAGNIVVVSFLLTDVHGRPIPNSEARSLVTGSCRVTVSASGAQSLPATCPTYIGLLRSYALLWNTSKKSGDVTMRISVAYPGGDTQIVNVPIRLR
jgi:arabinogalactan endo-1,4-beta-galactosidase